MATGKGKYECLVLVHGFHEELPRRLMHPRKSQHKYSKILAGWARSLSAPGKLQGVDLKIWDFRMADSLAADGQIKKLAQDLDIHLQEKFESRSRLPDDLLDVNSKQAVGIPRLVFITHGIGAWVVRELFGSLLSMNYRPYVSGVVFVDALQLPDTVSTPTTMNNKYREYLVELIRTFKLNIARKYLKGLIDQMEWIDNHSIKALKGFPGVSGVGTAKMSQKDLWLSSENSELSTSTQVEIDLRLSNIEEEVGKLLHGVTDQQFLANYTDATPKSPATPVLESQHHLGTTQWPQSGSPISSSDLSVSSRLESSSSFSSEETLRKPAGDAVSVLSSRAGPGSKSAQQEMNPVSVLSVESSAMSIARTGKLRNAEALLSQCLHTDPAQEATFLDRLRIRLELCVIRLQQGRLNIVEREFDDIEAIISRPPAKIEKTKILGLRTALMIWRSVLKMSRGAYDWATFNLENLMRSGSDTHRLLQSDHLLTTQLHITLAMSYAFTGNRRGAEAEMDEAEPICFHDFEPAERASTSAILLLDSKANFWAARTRIDVSFGQYQRALSVCQKALETARADCGTTHFQTLELASMEGHLLGFSSSPSRAEKTCSQTLRLIVKELGIEHPLALETTGHVVDALLARSRHVEATDTARSLYKVCKSALGKRHPSTLRTLHQLSRLHLATGKYFTAHEDLTRILSSPTGSTRLDPLFTLKFQSELADACCKLGRNQEGFERAKAVLCQHAKMHMVSSSGDNPADNNFGSKRWKSCLSSSNTPDFDHNFVSSYNFYHFFQSSQEANDSIIVSPDVLSTLEVLATAEQLEHKPVVMEFVHDQRKRLFGKDSMQYLESQHQLAVCYQGLGKLTEAIKLLDEVWKKRKELLSTTNPQTLSAERDLIITVIAHGESTLPPSIISVGIVCSAVDIAGLHEWQLGKLHPETLKSYIWAFTVQTVSSAKSSEALDTLSTILGRLRDNSVRNERLIQSLNMEDSLACFYDEQKMPRDALKIWQSLESLLKELVATGDGSKDETLQSFQRRLCSNIERSMGKIEGTEY